MKILLLVQDKNNRSVLMLAQSLRARFLLEPQDDTLCIFEIKDVQLLIEGIPSISDGKSKIYFKDISLVIKRTWGPIRTQGLAICKILEEKGVQILNGCDFIGWSHSKIRQYCTLQSENNHFLFPKTVVMDAHLISTIIKEKKIRRM